MLMTYQRVLPGLQRTGPNAWRWGCWEITRRDTDRPFWVADDTVSELDGWAAYERMRVCMNDRDAVTNLLRDLATEGPEPISAKQEAQS